MIRACFRSLVLLTALAWLPACQTLSFYGQAVHGQWEILHKARPATEVAADPATSPQLRGQLAMAARIRRFATSDLALPGEENFGTYADLGRPHVVWVLYATPEFSLQPKTWFYPFVGTMDYRGYFREADANALAEQLRKTGHDVYVGGVDAYSSLGWFHDPVLNTFVNYPDIHLAETIFHELTHLKYFRRGDTEFNEAMANVVAEEGVKRWLRHEGRLADLRRYQVLLERRSEFYQELNRAQDQLTALYASGQPIPVMRRDKSAIFDHLRDQFRELHYRWGGRGLEEWLVGDINNGHILSLKIYADRMPRFRAELAAAGGDFRVFFQQVARLAH